jgi:hypothetical protein
LKPANFVKTVWAVLKAKSIAFSFLQNTSGAIYLFAMVCNAQITLLQLQKQIYLATGFGLAQQAAG